MLLRTCSRIGYVCLVAEWMTNFTFNDSQIYSFSSLFMHRQWIVDYLLAVCQHLLISHGTRFLAVELMDHFMDKHVVMDYRMKLVALTCLLVAGGCVPCLPLCRHCPVKTEISATYLHVQCVLFHWTTKFYHHTSYGYTVWNRNLQNSNKLPITEFNKLGII